MYSIEGAERSSSIESFVYRVIFSHQILKSESRIEAPICSMATITAKKERTVNKFSCLCHFSKSLIKASNKIPFRKKRLVAFFSTPQQFVMMFGVNPQHHSLFRHWKTTYAVLISQKITKWSCSFSKRKMTQVFYDLDLNSICFAENEYFGKRFSKNNCLYGLQK